MSNRMGRWLGIDGHAEPPAEPPTPRLPPYLSMKAALDAFDDGTITADQLREAYQQAYQDPDAAAPALVHEQLAPSLALCGATATSPGLVTATNPSDVTCTPCREARDAVERRMSRVAPMTVSGGPGVTWTTDEYPVADDWPVVPISAEQIDPELIGKISMIDTIDEHLTVTADRVEEMAETLKALQKAVESLQEAADGPETPVLVPLAPTPSSDLREDILAVLEEFGHDPEVAAEILAERFRDVPPAERLTPPVRYPVIVKDTWDHMTVQDRRDVGEALKRGESEVTPEGHLRVGEGWIFSEKGWCWSDAELNRIASIMQDPR